MGDKLLTTGQAALLCSVTPDTVRKWIAGGRLAAIRTPGGHHRIEREELDKVVEATKPKVELPPPSHDKDKPFQFCWEYNGRGVVLKACRECAVYKMRALRCYEVVKNIEFDGGQIFCENSCDDCEYYRLVHRQETNVLVVSDDELLVRRLGRNADLAPFNLRMVNCEYACSALIDTFRPDFVVVDCSLGGDECESICDNLANDSRIPLVRLILAASPGSFPSVCNREVFAKLEKPFAIEDVTDCILGAQLLHD